MDARRRSSWERTISAMPGDVPEVARRPGWSSPTAWTIPATIEAMRKHDPAETSRSRPRRDGVRMLGYVAE